MMTETTPTVSSPITGRDIPRRRRRQQSMNPPRLPMLAMTSKQLFLVVVLTWSALSFTSTTTTTVWGVVGFSNGRRITLKTNLGFISNHHHHESYVPARPFASTSSRIRRNTAYFRNNRHVARASLSIDRLENNTPRKQSPEGGVPPGSPLDMICKDQHEFELSVGRAMDTLRTDYPHILTHNPGTCFPSWVHPCRIVLPRTNTTTTPHTWNHDFDSLSLLLLLKYPPVDFSIYDPDLEIIDPSGVRLHGVKNYKSAFRLLHVLVGLFYCPDQSRLTFRMCFDKARQHIRIHWNAQVIPKPFFGGYKTTLYADGISVYELCRNSGNITQHRIERLIINDNAIAPELGVFAAMRGYAANAEVAGNIPYYHSDLPSIGGEEEEYYQTGTMSAGDSMGSLGNSPTTSSLSSLPSYLSFQNFRPTTRSVLFSQGKEDGERSSSSLSPSSSPYSGQYRTTVMMESSSSTTSSSFDGNDLEALERKNLARKKFGLKPLTPEEFMDLQKKVQELDVQQQQRAAAAAAEMAQKKSKQENPGFFKKLFGEAMKDTCDSNYDCQRPEVCCDFGFKKMCCSSGMRIMDGAPQSRQGQLAEIPVIANPGPYPPDDYDPRQGNRY